MWIIEIKSNVICFHVPIKEVKDLLKKQLVPSYVRFTREDKHKGSFQSEMENWVTGDGKSLLNEHSV